MELDPLLPRIESAIAVFGVSQTALGYYAVGDPTLVGKMKRGMHLRTRRREKVVKALEKIEKAEGIPG